MSNNCSNINCFHLDHDVERTPEIGLLNTIVDRLNLLSEKLDYLFKSIEYIYGCVKESILNQHQELTGNSSGDLEELALRQSEFENYILNNRESLGSIASTRFFNEYEKLKEVRNSRKSL